MENESRVAVTRAGAAMGSCCLLGQSSVWEAGGGGCTAARMCSVPWNCACKNR